MSGCEFTVEVPSQRIESNEPKLTIEVLIRVTSPVDIAPALCPIGSHPSCYPLILPIQHPARLCSLKVLTPAT